jgi:hypothetical protein
LGRQLTEVNLIIWDEVPMQHRFGRCSTALPWKWFIGSSATSERTMTIFSVGSR